jgi:hypothetical protein
MCNSGTTTIIASGAGAGASVGYAWSNASTTASIIIGAGTYTVTATGTNSCTATASYTITNSAVTVSIVGNLFTCNGRATTLMASGTATAYAWSSNTTTAAITVSAGTYTVTVTGTNGCTATTSAIVTNAPVISASITGNTYACNSGTTTITASGTGATTYAWSDGGSAAATTVWAGTYTVTVANASGCTATASVNVLTRASATLTQTQTSCGQAQITCTNPPFGWYQWTGPMAPVSSNYSTLPVSTSGIYQLTVAGYCSTPITVNIPTNQCYRIGGCGWSTIGNDSTQMIRLSNCIVNSTLDLINGEILTNFEMRANLVIDQDVKFRSNQVIMHPGTTIIVLTGALFGYGWLDYTRQRLFFMAWYRRTIGHKYQCAIKPTY